MNKHYQMTIAIVIMVLFLSIGAAQAAQLQQTDGVDGIINIPIPPNKAWKTDYILTNPDVGSHVSIAFDPDHNDAPWIAFHNETYGSLFVAHYVGLTGGNCGPGNRWYCEQVDQVHAENKGLYTSIDVFPDTNPDPFHTTWRVGVSYYDASHKSLKYARLSCPIASPCEWTVYTVDSPSDIEDNYGMYTSMKFDSVGDPHIAYYANDDMGGGFVRKAVKYAYYLGDGTGDCGDDADWDCDRVDFSFSTLGEYPSLDIDYEGHVFIAYYDAANGNLKMAQYYGIGNCGDGNVWYCEDIDVSGTDDVGLFPSLHAPFEDSDFMRIAYYDATNGDLKYAYDTPSTGNCGPGNGWQCNAIDKMGADLTWASISLDLDPNQKPVIAYTDASHELAPLGLKIAEPAGFGQPTGTCDGYSINWYCHFIDSGNGYVDDGEFAALSIQSDGYAMVAYSEQLIDYPGTYSLKFAQEILRRYLPITQR